MDVHSITQEYLHHPNLQGLFFESLVFVRRKEKERKEFQWKIHKSSKILSSMDQHFLSGKAYNNDFCINQMTFHYLPSSSFSHLIFIKISTK